MDIRLIALDVDDTILTRELVIPQAVREAIREAQEAGVIVTLATGRMFASVRPYAESLRISAPLITYNGALVQDLHGTCFAERLIPKAGIVELAQMAASKGVTLNLYIDDRLYIAEMNEAVEFYLSIAQIGAHEVGDLTTFANGLPDGKGALKALLIAQPDQVQAMLPSLQERYRGRFEVVASQARFIEFTAEGVSKGDALATLCGSLGIASEQVMAAGDNFNDITMLQYAGLGVAVRNAPEQVQRVADVVVGTAVEGGIAEAIRRFVLSGSDRAPEVVPSASTDGRTYRHNQ